ncbi:MAG: nitroreductase family protein [Alphaproteobacteria bacterium]|nr:nitroreductase family protein [Alphaproteobacteria bacterium]MCY4318844.1 nitroreductase family protein [Alphaproteobacteria bacterium]
MELDEAMRTTFACRDFTGDPVSDATLYRLLETARFAPSGGNRQGNQVIVVRDPDTKARLSALSEPAAKRYAAQVKRGESPWNTIHSSAVTEEEAAATQPPSVLTGLFRKAPVVLVFIVDLGVVASMDRHLDRVGVISGASIYPFVWNTLLAARQAGLGGTITTLAVAEEPQVKRLLAIPDHFAVAAVVPLGRPVHQLTKLRRRSVAEIAMRERFGGEALAES